MDDRDWLAQRFEQHRGRLRAVAYRMLGSASDADDAVQETWLRLSRSDTSTVENLAGLMTTVIGRVCLTMLQTRRVRREEPLGGHSLEHSDAAAALAGPEEQALLADSLGVALIVVLDTLTPRERLAFVLHDLFGVPFDEIAPIVDRSPAAARQLASRARRRVSGAAEVRDADVARRRAVVDAFLAASREGDLDGLVALLAEDVVLRADQTAVRAGATSEVRGAAAVAEAFTGRIAAFQRALVDGAPGAVLAPGGKVWAVFAFSFRNGRIAAIELVGDPRRIRQFDIEFLSP